MDTLRHAAGRRGWRAGVVALLAAIATAEMSVQYDLALDRMTTEYLSFAATMNALPIETPVPRAFKLFSGECKKLDAIARGGASKIQKIGGKCLTKLERLGAEQQLLDDVTTARDDHLDSLALQLRRNYQKEAADRLILFVQSN
jgi:hypothetical protein